MPWAPNKSVDSFMQTSYIFRSTPYKLPQAVRAPPQIKVISIGQRWEANAKVVCVWAAQRVYAYQTSEIYMLATLGLAL